MVLAAHRRWQHGSPQARPQSHKGQRALCCPHRADNFSPRCWHHPLQIQAANPISRALFNTAYRQKLAALQVRARPGLQAGLQNRVQGSGDVEQRACN